MDISLQLGHRPQAAQFQSRVPEIMMPAIAKAIPTTRQALPTLAYIRDDVPASEAMPERAAAYPELRYLGSKNRLLPWIHGVLSQLSFETAADPFLGSGCVAYLLKGHCQTNVAG